MESTACLTLDEPECDQQAKQVIAYPPISRGRLKEESQPAENQDEFNVVEHQVIFGLIEEVSCPRFTFINIIYQLISQEEGNQNPRDESLSASIISTATADVSTACN